MPLLIQAVWVFEAGFGHAQGCGLLVHERGEILQAVRDVQGQGRSRIVAGGQHEPIEQILDGVALSRLQIHG